MKDNVIDAVYTSWVDYSETQFTWAPQGTTYVTVTYDGSTEGEYYDLTRFVPVVSEPILVRIIIDSWSSELIEFNEN